MLSIYAYGKRGAFPSHLPSFHFSIFPQTSYRGPNIITRGHESKNSEAVVDGDYDEVRCKPQKWVWFVGGVRTRSAPVCTPVYPYHDRCISELRKRQTHMEMLIITVMRHAPATIVPAMISPATKRKIARVIIWLLAKSSVRITI